MQRWLDDRVRAERTGWRDQKISQRHRLWGFNCPAVDIDFLVVEYNVGKPVAIVDYKHYQASAPDLSHPTYRALLELADIAQLPFLIAFYWPESWAFKITPVNEFARAHFADNEMLTERDYVERLYKLRRLVLAKHLKDTLFDVLPPASHPIPMQTAALGSSLAA